MSLEKVEKKARLSNQITPKMAVQEGIQYYDRAPTTPDPLGVDYYHFKRYKGRGRTKGAGGKAAPGLKLQQLHLVVDRGGEERKSGQDALLQSKKNRTRDSTNDVFSSPACNIFFTLVRVGQRGGAKKKNLGY